MFGFTRKAKEEEAKMTGQRAVIYRAIRTTISDQLHESATWLVGSHCLAKSSADVLAAYVSKIQRGFDAVLIDGSDAYGPELADADQLVKGGAMVAQAAGNLAVISGKVGHPNIRGDVFYMLGFSRDGSARRDDPDSETFVQLTTPSRDAVFTSMHSRIAGIIESRRADALAYLAEVQAGLHPAPESTIGKLSAAKDFVEKSTTGSAALDVWRHTIHYHAWQRREDWPKWNDIGVSEIAEQSDPSPASTGFRWHDRAWNFALKRSGPSYSGDKDLGEFQVSVDGELVLQLAVAKGYGEFDEWHHTDVQVLTVGVWAGVLVEMSAELALAQRRRWAETETARLETQASRIKFG